MEGQRVERGRRRIRPKYEITLHPCGLRKKFKTAISIKFNLAQVSIQNWCGAMKPEGVGPPPSLPSASQLGWAEVTYDHLKRAALLRNLRFHMEFPIKIHCIRLPMSFQFQIGRQIARRLVCFTFGHRAGSTCRCNIIPIDLVIFFFFPPLKFENRRIRSVEDISLSFNAKKD